MEEKNMADTKSTGKQLVPRAEFSSGVAYNAIVTDEGRLSAAGRMEFTNGQKLFDVTYLSDGTRKVGRVEFPDGEKRFDGTNLLV